jgi:hypothetical protein
MSINHAAQSRNLRSRTAVIFANLNRPSRAVQTKYSLSRPANHVNMRRPMIIPVDDQAITIHPVDRWHNAIVAEAKRLGF